MMIFSIIPREVFDRVQHEMARGASLNRKKQKYVKTQLGKYALIELLVCGKCDTDYRRAVWSKNGQEESGMALYQPDGIWQEILS